MPFGKDADPSMPWPFAELPLKHRPARNVNIWAGQDDDMTLTKDQQVARGHCLGFRASAVPHLVTLKSARVNVGDNGGALLSSWSNDHTPDLQLASECSRECASPGWCLGWQKVADSSCAGI